MAAATGITSNPPLPPWLSSGGQSIGSACGSANNYCNNGNMQACQWRDKECSGVGYATEQKISGNVATAMPWLSSAAQSIGSACGSAHNYCNNGNMLACEWRDKECSNVGYATIAATPALLPGTPAWCTWRNTDCMRGQQGACHDFDNHCFATVSATATGVGNASVSVCGGCEIEKSEIKNLKTELSDVHRGCDDHVEHLRAELDAAKAMIGAMDAVEAGAMEKDIDSLQLVSPLINSLGPDPSPLTAEEEENDAVRAEIGARMFVTSGDINSVGQFVDHVWKGIGWEWGDSSGFTNTTDTNESDSDNIFGAKYSSISRPNPPPNPPIFKMTESNIRLFRK
jgi:hypothetical protein